MWLIARYKTDGTARRAAARRGDWSSLGQAKQSTWRRVHEITLILEAARRGDPAAAERLMDAVYSELRALASAKMAAEYGNVTLQPTALVHEAWLRLGGDAQPRWQNRAHFFAAAAEAMRRILIDRARRRNRVRHGAGQRPIDLDGVAESLAAVGAEADDRLLAVNEALERFAAVEPERAQLVKLRYFVGLTLEEAAAVLDVSESTAKRWWAFSRAWLYREISSDDARSVNESRHTSTAEQCD